MGGISNMDRSNRFVEAFNDLARRDYGPEGKTARAIFEDYGLGYDEYAQQVRMYWGYKDTEQSVQLILDGPVFYDPNWDDIKVMIDTLEGLFENGGTTREEIIKLLKKAELLEEKWLEQPAV